MKMRGIFGCFIIAVLLPNIFYGCGSVSTTSATAAESQKPVLSLVEKPGVRYLVDQEGGIYSYLIPPMVRANFTEGTFYVAPNIEYGPAEHYDGFTVEFGGHPRSGAEPKYFELGPAGGDFSPLPGSYDRCTVQGFIVDGAGTRFETERTVLFYIKH